VNRDTAPSRWFVSRTVVNNPGFNAVDSAIPSFNSQTHPPVSRHYYLPLNSTKQSREL